MKFKYQYINQQNPGQESSLRKGSMQNLKLVKQNKGKSDQQTGRLWRMFNQKAATEDQKSTQKSNVLTLKSEGYRRHLKSQESNKSQPDINQFLLHVHQKINTSQDYQIEESVIMEKFSLDWVQEEQKQKEVNNRPVNQGSLRPGQDHRFLHEGSRTQRIGCPDLEAIKSIENLDDFQQMMSILNPKIYTKISNLIQQNQKLHQDCNNLRYIEKKAIVKIDLLKNEIGVLEKKNKAIQNKFINLKNKCKHQQSDFLNSHSEQPDYLCQFQERKFDSLEKQLQEKCIFQERKESNINEFYSPRGKIDLQLNDCLQKEVNIKGNHAQKSQLKQQIFSKKKNSPKLTPQDYNDIVFDILKPATRRTPKHN